MAVFQPGEREADRSPRLDEVVLMNGYRESVKVQVGARRLNTPAPPGYLPRKGGLIKAKQPQRVVAEGEGFEPSEELSPFTRFPSVRTRPDYAIPPGAPKIV